MKKARQIFTMLVLALSVSLQAGIGEGQSQEGPLPVELISFSASVNSNVVLLNWSTATEVNNYGFEVQRAANLRGLPNLEGFETLGFVNGHGNSDSPKEYSFVDSSPLSGNVSYRLKQIDTDGNYQYSTVIELKGNLLKEYVLEQNYPNPFNPTTVISYSIPKASFVTIKVYDVLANEISTLVNELQDIGSYQINFDAANLSNGVYFYKLTALSNSEFNYTDIKKMLLVK